MPLEFCKLSAEDNGQGLGESEAMSLLPTLVGIVLPSVVASSSDIHRVRHEADMPPRWCRVVSNASLGTHPLAYPIVYPLSHKALVSAVAEVACRFNCQRARIETCLYQTSAKAADSSGVFSCENTCVRRPRNVEQTAGLVGARL